MKQLYIHVGTGKTGTSAIQDFLFANKEVLAKEDDLKYIESGLLDNNHHFLCFNYFRSSKQYNKVYEELENLKNEILNSRCSRFIISSEYFPGLTQEEVEFYINFLKDICDINIIVYFRRPDKYAESWYAQNFKVGRVNETFGNLVVRLVRGGTLNYRHHVEKWSRHIGKDNVYVRAYQRSRLTNMNVIDDFLSIFSLHDKYQSLIRSYSHQKVTNPSTSSEQIALVSGIAPFIEKKIALKIAKPLGKSDFKHCFLTNFERYLLLKSCEPDITWLEKEFNSSQSLFDYPSQKPSIRQSDNQIVTKAYLVSFLADIEKKLNIDEQLEVKRAVVKYLTLRGEKDAYQERDIEELKNLLD